MPLYLITVNGIPYANQIDKQCVDYQLERLSQWPELEVQVELEKECATCGKQLNG